MQTLRVLQLLPLLPRVQHERVQARVQVQVQVQVLRQRLPAKVCQPRWAVHYLLSSLLKAVHQVERHQAEYPQHQLYLLLQGPDRRRFPDRGSGCASRREIARG